MYLHYLLTASCAQAARYRITALETPAADESRATAINSAGEVVGMAGDNATLWRNGYATDLGTMGEESSYASGINDKGVVVGTTSGEHAEDFTRAFIWTNGHAKDIGGLTKVRPWAIAHGINNKGQVVGYSPNAAGAGHAVLWDAANGMRDLVVPSPGEESTAYGINNKSQVVGESAGEACIWRDGKFTELPSLEGMKWGRARAINDHGVVAGESFNGYSDKKRVSHACRWNQSGKVTDLGTLGGNWSQAQAINNKGQIVGNSGEMADDPAKSYEYAVLWQDGKIADLNKLIPPDSGWVLGSATGVNDAGQIVGDGSFEAHKRAFLLTPIP